MKTETILTVSLAILSLAGCTTTRHETVTFEKKKGVTIVHHRRRIANGLVDRIDTLNSSGVVSRAEIHVYDVGRLPHGVGGMDEAHRYYRVVQSEHLDLLLPHSTLHPTGPKTVFAPPNYSPPPNDQRINDAVAEAKRAKEMLEAATKQVQERLKEDNSLRGELQAQIDENQRLQDQINAGFATPHLIRSPIETDLAHNRSSTVLHHLVHDDIAQNPHRRALHRPRCSSSSSGHGPRSLPHVRARRPQRIQRSVRGVTPGARARAKILS